MHGRDEADDAARVERHDEVVARIGEERGGGGGVERVVEDVGVEVVEDVGVGGGEAADVDGHGGLAEQRLADETGCVADGMGGAPG